MNRNGQVLKEISRMVDGMLALRLIGKEEGSIIGLEKFQSGAWVATTPDEVRKLSASNRIQEWLKKQEDKLAKTKLRVADETGDEEDSGEI